MIKSPSPLPEKGSIREMLDIAFPMIVSTSCDGIMTFTDRFFLSKLGPEQMNAAMDGGVAMQMLMFFFIGLTGYTTALVAQYYGSGQKRMGPVAAFQAILISLVAYPLILAFRPLVIRVFDMTHIPVEQIEFQRIYFNIVIFGVLISLLRNSISCYFSGLGRTRVVMVASLTAMGVNVGLDYLLIFGKLGLPALGIRGAAYATLTGGFSGLLILCLVYFGRKNRLVFRVMESFRFRMPVMRKLVHFGYPAGLELFLNMLAFTGIIYMFHARGSVVATATTIMFNWDLASFIPLLGIEIAVTSLVGRYMGACDPETAQRSAMSGIRTGLFYSVVILLLFLFIPDALARVFQPEGENEIFMQALPMARSMIRLSSVYVLAEAMSVALTGALRGAGDTRWTMIATVTLHWTFIPILATLFYLFNLSAIIGWLALIIAYLTFCVFLLFRYRSGKWKNIRMVEPELQTAS